MQITKSELVDLRYLTEHLGAGTRFGL